MRMSRLDRLSKRHIIRNNANKESNRIAKKISTGRIIRGAAVVRAVVPEDKVVADIKMQQLISVSSLALSHQSSLHQNQKNSQMRIHQLSNPPLATAVTANLATDK